MESQLTENILINNLNCFIYEESNPTNGRNIVVLNENYGTCPIEIHSPCRLSLNENFFCDTLNIQTIKANEYDTLNQGTYILNGTLLGSINNLNIKSKALLCAPQGSIFPARSINIGNPSSSTPITVILQGDFNVPVNIIGKSRLILENCTLSHLNIPNNSAMPVELELFPKYDNSPIITNPATLGSNVSLYGSIIQISNSISSNSTHLLNGYIEDVEILSNGIGNQNIPMPKNQGVYNLTTYLIENETLEKQFGTPKNFIK